MIRFKTRKRYFGSKAYLGEGRLGKITAHHIIEDETGLYETFYLVDGQSKETTEILFRDEIVVLDSVRFASIKNTIVAVAVVDGRTYVGYAVSNPNDETYDAVLGRKLALARAMQDEDGVAELMGYISEKNELETELDAEQRQGGTVVKRIQLSEPLDD